MPPLHVGRNLPVLDLSTNYRLANISSLDYDDNFQKSPLLVTDARHSPTFVSNYNQAHFANPKFQPEVFVPDVSGLEELVVREGMGERSRGSGLPEKSLTLDHSAPSGPHQQDIDAKNSFRYQWRPELLVPNVSKPVALVVNESTYERAQRTRPLDIFVGLDQFALSDPSDDVAFTDSGYGSIPSDKCPRNDGGSEGMHGSDDLQRASIDEQRNHDDTQTVYSENSLVSNIAHKSITHICDDIYAKLRLGAGEIDYKSLASSLPGIIKAFAIRLGSDRSNGLNQSIMCFIHKHCR